MQDHDFGRTGRAFPGAALSRNEALSQRYGYPMSAASEPWNPVLNLILAHRSVRGFLPQALPEGTLETITAAAQSAPTSSNLQMWSLVAVEDTDRKNELAKLAGNQLHISEAPLFLAFVVDHGLVQSAGSMEGIAVEGTDYLETFLVGAVDAALAAQNAVIACNSLGLGTVYIGAMRNHPQEVSRLLAIPPKGFVVFGLCVGYPDRARLSLIKPRLPQELVLHREQYQEGDRNAMLSQYNKRLQYFQRTVGMTENSWTKTASARVRNASALKGRDRLRTIARLLGFKLQ